MFSCQNLTINQTKRLLVNCLSFLIAFKIQERKTWIHLVNGYLTIIHSTQAADRLHFLGVPLACRKWNYVITKQKIYYRWLTSTIAYVIGNHLHRLHLFDACPNWRKKNTQLSSSLNIISIEYFLLRFELDLMISWINPLKSWSITNYNLNVESNPMLFLPFWAFGFFFTLSHRYWRLISFIRHESAWHQWWREM